MCLSIIDWRKRSLYKKRPKKFVIRWKVIQVPPQPYMTWVTTQYAERDYKIGEWYRAKQYKRTPRKCGAIHEKYISGFHVYSSFKDAKKNSEGYNSLSVVPVVCSGLLAKGRNDLAKYFGFEDIEVFQWVKFLDPRTSVEELIQKYGIERLGDC